MLIKRITENKVV